MRKAAIDVQDLTVRPRTLPLSWNPPSIRDVQAWVLQLSERGSSLLTMKGPNPIFRREAFNLCFDVPGLAILGNTKNPQVWLEKGIRADLTQRVRGITHAPWGLFQELLIVPDFVVEEPLRGLIDQGFRFTGFYKALWEARFLQQENRARESLHLLGSVIRWMTGADLDDKQKAALSSVGIACLLGESERLDMLLFLLALSYQNGLIDRAVFVLDGVDEVLRMNADRRKDMLRQLTETIQIFERWARLGSATGLVLGLDSEHNALGSITHYNSRLGKKIADALV